MKRGLLIGLSLALCAPLGAAHGDGNAVNPDVARFVTEMVERHQFNKDELTGLLSAARVRTDILTAIARPSEAKPWWQYRELFVTTARIQGGVEFWKRHADLLANAERDYGVPPEIIVAILGVETRYGKQTGHYRVLDALNTLAFHYPPRSDYFRSELEQFLLLAREENVDPLQPTGSYAGAMGQPQFMPHSFRHYAVDFDANGKRDIWNSVADVIGSVAYYFYDHGWQPGAAVVVPAQVVGKMYQALPVNDLKTQHSVRDLSSQGMTPGTPLADDVLAIPLTLVGKENPEFWLALPNFYVITRYNHSVHYAMAVQQLSVAIRANYLASNTPAKAPP